MKPQQFPKQVRRMLLCCLAVAAPVHGTDLSDKPVVTSTTTAVKPNLMFILDDSGSMGWSFMPDWAGDTTNGSSTYGTCDNLPIHQCRNSSFNSIAYNPARTYAPPAKFNADGSVDTATYKSQTADNTGNWTAVKDDGYGVQSQSTTNLTAAANKPVYFITKAGEYCKKPDLRSCNKQSEPSADYPEPAKLRWCNSSANAKAEIPAANSCQAVYIENNAPNVPGYYYNDRFPSPYTATITLKGNNNTIVSSVKVDGQEILSGATAASNKTNTVAASIRDKINACANAKAGNCQVIGYSASASGSTVTVYAPADTTATPAVTINGMAYDATAFAPGTVPGVVLRTVIDSSNDSYPYPGTAEKASGRSDCAGTTCTYAEEMTNYANWWAYYRTRMQMMKSATSIAFAPVDDSFRMGYISINLNANKDFLNIGLFDNAQKNAWYTKLFAASPGSSTPLRTALSKVGRLYAGKLTGAAVDDGANATDPVEYSCQQNFSLLSTDGYWNEAANPKQVDNATDIGNQDGTVANTAGIKEVRPRLDGANTSNALADVAEYYYTNDLRQSKAPFNNCTGALGKDVCDNNVPKSGTDDATWQHLTTFTLGLGASGYMQFDPNYASVTSGDFYSLGNDLVNPAVAPAKASLANGLCTWLADGKTCNWPIPVSNEQPNIDDLWHAAVNGRGSYYSAGNPEALAIGLDNLLASINSRTGAEAAAVTSNPNVIANDNFLFEASFTTVEWSGELDRRTISPSSGVISATPDWSAQARLDGKVADTDADGAVYNNARTIYYVEPTNLTTSNEPLRNFQYTGLSESAKSYFSQDYISSAAAPFGKLSQYCSAGTTCLSAKAKEDAAGKNLVNFLRGERANEGALSDTGKYYRQRKHVLGDIVNADPVYVKGALAIYDENGYQSFKDGVAATRRGMVYAAANDGMLHAFNAENIPAGCNPNAGTCTSIGGDEAWAHIPSFVLPNLYKLADKQYANNHRFYVDASPTVGDIYCASCTPAGWKTILVAGLGKGGKGYYALDITDPDNPKALWEFAPATMGYTYGNPVITKVNKKWVVLLASGYNNADGVGRLYVVDANTGALEKTLSTGQGTAANPSGLARISAWIDDGATDNYAKWAYGGDVLGNLFRFDLEAGTVQRMATLKDGAGKVQPITARPELGDIAGMPVVFVGTGRYLHSNDSDNSQQSFYALKDQRDATDYGDPRGYGGFIQQTVTVGICPEPQGGSCAAGQAVRTGSSEAVDFGTHNGWYLDLPLGEKANTDPILVYGTLVFNTNLPTATACSYGGSSYRYFLDYRTGSSLSNVKNGVIGSALLGGANGKDNVLASRAVIASVGSGMSLIQLTRLSDGTTRTDSVLIGNASILTRRSSWRELVTDQ